MPQSDSERPTRHFSFYKDGFCLGKCHYCRRPGIAAYRHNAYRHNWRAYAGQIPRRYRRGARLRPTTTPYGAGFVCESPRCKALADVIWRLS